MMQTSENQLHKLGRDGFLYGKSDENSDDFDVLLLGNYIHQNAVFPLDSQFRLIGEGAFKYSSLIEFITIPSNVTEICDNAFYGCSKLRSVVFAEDSKLRSIGQYAFKDTSIETITIPPLITEIREYTFCQCTNLRSVVFAKDSRLRSIKQYAFKDSSSINSITFPPLVTEICDNAFGGNLQNG